MCAGEAAKGIVLRVHLDLDPGGAQLRHHRVEVTHAQIEHPHLLWTPEVVGIRREWLEGGWPCFLEPRLILIALLAWRHAQMLLIPRLQRLRVARPKEEPADSRHALHRFSPAL